jgi:hypothetical protein
MALPSNSTSLPISNGGTITAANYWGNMSGSSHTTIAPPLCEEYVIQGQMYLAEHFFNDSDLMDIEPDEIKRRLAVILVDELFSKKAIEFTKAQDYSQGRTAYRARIYAVPDTMVRILRENGK